MEVFKVEARLMTWIDVQIDIEAESRDEALQKAADALSVKNVEVNAENIYVCGLPELPSVDGWETTSVTCFLSDDAEGTEPTMFEY